MTNEKEPPVKKWIDEAEETLNRTAEALRAAWDGTREARMSTLESAKEAANRLGEAIDQGIDVAKDTWDPSRKEQGAERTVEASDTGAATEDDAGQEEE